MEEEAPSHRSVAELARRFKGAAPPQSSARNEAEKPVRRRPPRSLQLSKPPGSEQEPPAGGPTSPVKVKRNSGLIEKLQAELTLSPTGPPMKSPGIRMLSPGFPLPSPGSAPPATSATTPSSSATPTSPVTRSPATEEQGPASFEDPPIGAEGSVLQSINKGRARHSIRRRPPSRRHRTSSSGDVEPKEAAETQPSEVMKTAGEEQEGHRGVFKGEDQREASTAPEKNKSHEEGGPKSSGGDVKEGGEGSVEGQSSSSEKKELEDQETSSQEEHLDDEATETDGREEETSQEAETSAP